MSETYALPTRERLAEMVQSLVADAAWCVRKLEQAEQERDTLRAQAARMAAALDREREHLRRMTEWACAFADNCRLQDHDREAFGVDLRAAGKALAATEGEGADYGR